MYIIEKFCLVFALSFTLIPNNMKIQVRDHNIYYNESGKKGQPVLFLHGVPDTSDVWKDIVSKMPKKYRCIVADWPGVGRSERGSYFDFDLMGHADYVNKLANALGIEGPFRLVGHDFGGISAMAFAAKYPKRVSQLVISNAPFSAKYKWHTWARVWQTPLLGQLSMAVMNKLIFHLSIKKGSKKLSGKQISETYKYVNSTMKSTILKMYRAVTKSEFKKWHPLLLEATKKIPTLVLWGQHDPYIPNWMPEEFGAKTIKRYPESGHWVPLEEPEMMVNDLLEFFNT
jgi:pimeloyl-ACP methyl ester carboxylesterase